MPKDRRHWIPASLIGYFSPHPIRTRLRENKVHVIRKDDSTRVFSTRAENIACSPKLYRGSLLPGIDDDDFFRPFEDAVHTPVKRLKQVFRSGLCDAKSWAKVAGYISMQFSRDPDYEKEIPDIAANTGWDINQIDIGYILDFPRFAAAVLRAEWVIMSDPSRSLILNDRGISVCKFSDCDVPGYFIPLRPDIGICIFGRKQKRLRWNGSSWSIEIPAEVISSDQAAILNNWTWASAPEMAMGRDSETLLSSALTGKIIQNQLGNIGQFRHGAPLLNLSAKERRDDEMLLQSLLSGIRQPSQKEDTNSNVWI